MIPNGTLVEVVDVAHPNLPHHAVMIGQRGTVLRHVKSRKCYVLRLTDGRTWDALVENVREVTDGT